MTDSIISIDDLQKEFGTVHCFDWGHLPFRCYAANLLVGGEGLARAQVIEIFGGHGSGKTTLALELCAIAVAAGDLVLIKDQEKSIEQARAAKFGLHYGKNVYYDRETTVEALGKSLGDVFKYVAEKEPTRRITIMVDSLGIMIPQDSYDKTLDEKQKVAASARAWALVMRWMSQHFHDLNVTWLILNHQTHDIQTSPFGGSGPKKTTPGGETVKHIAFTRLQMTSIGRLYNKEKRVIGNNIKLKTMKCKSAPPFQEVVLPLYFGNPTLLPHEDFVGTYDPMACFYHLKSMKAVGTGNRSVSLYSMETGEKYTVKLTGEPDFCNRVFGEHRANVYFTMQRLHYSAGAFTR